MVATITAIYLLFAVSVVTALPSSCPRGWIHRGTSCYLFVNDAVDAEDWMVAMSFCSSLHAKLVEIETVTEDEFLRLHLLDNKLTGSYWIGLSDIQAEGVWVWTSSQNTPTYTNWPPGQPDNNAGEEDCAHLYAAFGFQWNDYPCNKANNFICEKELRSQEEIVG
ncbi:perlucin-like [Saccostrea cucullata]|uniref:perlucin-like n=1 Tax=Saccostrea cuccullata TaxID=36930 RepID=UPI002ED39AF7